MDARIKFIAKFLPLYFIPFFLISRVIPLGFLTDLIASTESFFLSSAGVANTLRASFIFTTAINYEIVAECTGLSMVILLFALLYSAELDNKKRVKTMLFFTPILLFFNLLRLFAVLWLGAKLGQQGLDYAHPAFWFVDAAIVFAIWYYRLETQKRKTNKNTQANKTLIKQKKPRRLVAKDRRL